MSWLAFVLLVVAWTMTSPALVAKEAAPVGIEQRLGTVVPGNIDLRDEAGRNVTLGSLIRKKPSILALVYFQCPNLCTFLLNDLVKAVKGSALTPGRDLEVVAVSIDPTESPPLAAAKKATYLKAFGRQETAAGWHFLTGSAAALQELAQTLGIRYQYDAKRHQYNHPAALIILTPALHIARYIYGLGFEPRSLRLAVVEASRGKLATPLDQFLLLCFHYDSASGRYGPAVMNIVRLVAGLTFLALCTLVAWLIRSGRAGYEVAQNP